MDTESPLQSTRKDVGNEQPLQVSQYHTTDYREILLMVGLYQLTIVFIMVSWLHQTAPWRTSQRLLEHLHCNHMGALEECLLNQSQKQDMIGLFMSTFVNLLEVQEAADGASPTSQNSGSQQPLSHTRSPSHHGTNETASSTPRLAKDDAGDDGDGGADSPRAKKRKLNEIPPKSLFACPFFKRDPSRYQSERACVGPGWPSIHRMKYITSH